MGEMQRGTSYAVAWVAMYTFHENRHSLHLEEGRYLCGWSILSDQESIFERREERVNQENEYL